MNHSIKLFESNENKLISQGAEGKVYLSTFAGIPSIIKYRVSKSYRVKELDIKITKQRLLQEARCMVKCRRAGILTPDIFHVDTTSSVLHMQRIIGKTMKEVLLNQYSLDKTYSDISLIYARNIGIAVGKMHEAEVIHGDLTTSNIMIPDDSSSNDVVLIDFGLASMKPVIEDKAVDLYVMERAFQSTHPDSHHLVTEILQAYRFANSKGSVILHKLEQVCISMQFLIVFNFVRRFVLEEEKEI